MRKLILLLEYLLIMLIGLTLALTITTFGIKPSKVSGRSMDPTLKDGEQIITNVFMRIVQPIERFDIVVLKINDNEKWIKRVIALPGETITYKNNVLFINGKEVQQPFLDKTVTTNDFSNVTLGEDEYFVMGDNRQHSLDSRARIVNKNHFKGKDIISKAAYVFWPLDKMRIAK